MADMDGSNETKDFYLDIPARNTPFFLKGSGALDWGMQNRFARIFNAASGRTVMLAIDHGYFQGPTTGLERVDVNIIPLLPYADALMLTRGILRTTIPPTFARGTVLRASGGPSILKELSNEQIALDIEDALRLNAAAMAVQVFVGGEYESQSIHNLTRLVDLGARHGVPVLGVTAVGKNMTRDARYFRLAAGYAQNWEHTSSRLLRAEGFETITLLPGPRHHGRREKIPESESLEMAYRCVSEGPAGVDIWGGYLQSKPPPP